MTPPAFAIAPAVAVIPVFDEARTVGRLVGRLRATCPALPVLVVDDASTDGGAACARAAGAADVLRHRVRAGKAAALRTGFAAALRRGAGAVVTLDGDGQHDPADLPRLLAAAAAVRGALVLGDRLADPDGDPIPSPRLLGIRLADRLLGRILRQPVRDSQCGYRVYPAALLRAVPLVEERFALETEILVGAVRAGIPLVSVPVRRLYPAGRRSRFRTIPDGLAIIRYLLSELVTDAPVHRVRVPAASLKLP